MKLSVGPDLVIQLEEVFNPITLKSREGEEVKICMRDSGFEFQYEGVWYSAKEGEVKPLKLSSRGNILVDQTDKEDAVAVGPGSTN